MVNFNGQENYFFNTCFQLCWTIFMLSAVTVKLTTVQRRQL